MEAETLVVIEVVVGAASSLKGIKMDAETWVFIGVVVGAASSIGTTAWIARNASKAKTREFQRDNLMQIQDRLSQHVAWTIKHHKKSRLDKLLTDESIEDFIISSNSIMILMERIADESLRVSVFRLTDTLHSCLQASSTNDTTKDEQERLKIIMLAAAKVWEEIGVAIRSHY